MIPQMYSFVVHSKTPTEYSIKINEFCTIFGRRNTFFRPLPLVSPPPQALPLQLQRRIAKHTLIRAAEKDALMHGMSYDPERDTLFLADRENRMVRARRLRDRSGDRDSALRDVHSYRSPADSSVHIWSVCHIGDTDTLLVCLYKQNKRWLVALSRSGSRWREAQRVQTAGNGDVCCALSDSRVLIGEGVSGYMELFRVKRGPRIVRVHRIKTGEYRWCAATCGSQTLVAMSYNDNSVRLHRLRGDRLLEELALATLQIPILLLWLADRLLVTESHRDTNSYSVTELEVNGARLERRVQLIGPDEGIGVFRWCAVDDGLAIFDGKSKDILLYTQL